MDKLFVDTMLAFVKSSMADRDLKAFKCLWVSFLMIFWEIFKILGSLGGSIIRMASVILSVATSGTYILIGHPLLLIFSFIGPKKTQ